MLSMETRLKEWREKRGLTVRGLGELSGVHYVSVVKMDAGVDTETIRRSSGIHRWKCP